MSLIHRKRNHHRTRKSSVSKKNVLERFLTSYFLKISGSILLLIGFYYALSSLDKNNVFKELIFKLFQPSVDLSMQRGKAGSDVTIIYYFLPGILILILAGLLAKRFSFITYIISLLSVIYFIIIQTKILVYDFYFGGAAFPPILIVDIFLIFTIITPFINTILLKKPLILNLTSVFFYLSSVMLVTMDRLQLNFILSLLMVFSLFMVWSDRKIKNPAINLVNFILAIIFFGLLWLRKLLVNSQLEYLLPFFIYGVLYYILFYGIVFYSSSAKEKAMPKWMQLTMGFTNLLFYVGTTSYVIIEYYSFGYLWIFALALLLFNLIGLYLSGKYFPAVWKLPHHIATIILAALILPLLLNQSILLLFTAGLSILLLLYSKYSKNQTSIIISMIAMGIMSFDFFFHWIFKYLPALVFSNDLPDASLLWHGILSGAAVVAALILNNLFLKDIEVTLSKKIFNRARYTRLVKGLILFTLFLSSGWIVSALLCYLSGTMQLVAPGWFISGSVFLILMIILKPQRFSSFSKPILFLAPGYILTYPLLVHLNMLASLNNLMFFGIFSIKTVLIHYLALGLLIGLAAISMVRVYGLYPLNKALRRGIQISGLAILLFILFTEYDNLSILLRAGQFILKPSLGMGQEILEYNLHLPYSVILLASSLLILVWSLFKHYRFLRNFSIILFSLSIVKIFLYDFTLLGDTIRTVLFFVIGLLLLGFSIYYPKLKKAATAPRDHHRNNHREKSTRDKTNDK